MEGESWVRAFTSRADSPAWLLDALATWAAFGAFPKNWGCLCRALMTRTFVFQGLLQTSTHTRRFKLQPRPPKGSQNIEHGGMGSFSGGLHALDFSGVREDAVLSKLEEPLSGPLALFCIGPAHIWSFWGCATPN